MSLTLERRAHLHATLGEPNRLAIVDQLGVSDRTPSQLSQRLGLPSNLLAHHLDVLEQAGLIDRFPSGGDRRRRYVRLIREPLARLSPVTTGADRPALFICTHNAARSQLAAALWRSRTGQPARSAGTDPAPAVHPAARAAAARAGLELGPVAPTALDPADGHGPDLVITVCDRACEELAAPVDWWHWSTPDPIPLGTDAAFDATVAELDLRITALL